MNIKSGLCIMLKIIFLVMLCISIYINNNILLILTIIFQCLSFIVFGWSISISILGSLKKYSKQ